MPKLISIPPSQISVLIQGPLHSDKAEGIQRCLDSITTILPGAQVVVSTWKNEESATELLIGVNRFYFSDDPGPDFTVNGRPYNLRRMLLTTSVGLDGCDRDYVLKFRADCMLTNANICTTHISDDGKPGLTVSNFFIPNPEVKPFLFHLPDTVQFGKKNVLQSIWEYDPTKYSSPNATSSFLNASDWKVPYYPEQAIAMKWLESLGQKVKINRPYRVTPALFAIWQKLIADKITIVDVEKCGVLFPERFYQFKPWQLTEQDFRRATNLSLSLLATTRVYLDTVWAYYFDFKRWMQLPKKISARIAKVFVGKLERRAND